jgi:hypothetical protein
MSFPLWINTIVNNLGIIHAKLVYKPYLAINEPCKLYKEDVTKKGTTLSSCMDHVGKMNKKALVCSRIDHVQV